MLTAEGVRWICCAAREKLPVSEMARKVRRISISRSGRPWGEFGDVGVDILTSNPLLIISLFEYRVYSYSFA